MYARHRERSQDSPLCVSFRLVYRAITLLVVNFSSLRGDPLVPLVVTESKDIMPHNFYYSDKYYDDQYEYRHVVLPKELVKLVPRTHLLSEQEWRAIGVQQSQGWVHYMIHDPEPHVLLFKRKITTPPEGRGEEK